MHSRRCKGFISIWFLAAVCLTAPTPSNAAQTITPGALAAGLPGWLESLTQFAKPYVKRAAGKVESTVNNNKDGGDALGIITAILGLLVTAMPVLLKTYESFLLRSKTKDLDRIQDLIALMEKTKKEKVLEGSTLDAVCAQIDLEIHAALESLEQSREHRKEVIEKRKQTIEKRRLRQDPELTLTSSALLLFRPRGLRAWLAHSLAFAAIFLAALGGLIILRGNQYWGLWLTMSVIAVAASLLARTWALWERKQWKTARASGIRTISRTIYFRPHNFRTAVALLFAFWWLFLVVVSGLSMIFDHVWYVLLIPSSFFFWLSRKWALYERERWLKKHPQLQNVPEVTLMEGTEGAALPAGPG